MMSKLLAWTFIGNNMRHELGHGSAGLFEQPTLPVFPPPLQHLQQAVPHKALVASYVIIIYCTTCKPSSWCLS